MNEWANIVDAGASCIAMQRNPEPGRAGPERAPLPVRRRAGSTPSPALDFEQRLDFLGKTLRGTSPERRGLGGEGPPRTDEGRFEQVFGEVTTIAPGPAGLRVNIELLNGAQSGRARRDRDHLRHRVRQVGALAPLLRRLAQTYDVPIVRERSA